MTRLYCFHRPIIGITGGIATGKSTVSKILSSKYPLVCADTLIKDIYEYPETKKFLYDNYPRVIDCDKINFRKLRELAFSDEDVRLDLEGFLYPRLPLAFYKTIIKNGWEGSRFVFYDVPLLFETGIEKLLDGTVCVYADRESQLKRLMRRDVLVNKDLANSMIDSQMDIERKKSLSGYVLNNTSTISELENQIENMLDWVGKQI